MAIKALIVDLDGTLWDSFPFYASIVEPFSARSIQELIGELLAGTSVVALIDQSPGIGRRGFEQSIRDRIDELTVYDRVSSTLEALALQGIPLSILTSLPHWITYPMLESTNLYARFDTIVDASSPHRKPTAAALRSSIPSAAQSLHVADVVYVGDTEIDSRTAQAFGCRFAWASYGYQSDPPARVDHTLNRFADVLHI